MMSDASLSRRTPSDIPLERWSCLQASALLKALPPALGAEPLVVLPLRLAIEIAKFAERNNE